MKKINKKNYNIEIKIDADGNYEWATVTDENGLDVYKKEWEVISKLITQDFVAYPDDLKQYENIVKLNNLQNKHKIS